MWTSCVPTSLSEAENCLPLFSSPTCSRYPLTSGYGCDAHPSADENLLSFRDKGDGSGQSFDCGFLSPPLTAMKFHQYPTLQIKSFFFSAVEMR